MLMGMLLLAVPQVAMGQSLFELFQKGELNAAVTDALCKPQFDGYRRCLSEKTQVVVQALNWRAVQQCFSSNGCPEPDENNVMKTVQDQKQAGIDGVDDDTVINCAHEHFSKDKQALHECVKNDHPWLNEIPTLDGYEKQGLQVIIASKNLINICGGDRTKRDAVRQCLGNNDNTNLHLVRQGMCNANRDCKTKVTPNCETEAEGLAKHLCDCARQKTTENDGQRMDQIAMCISNGNADSLSPYEKQRVTAIINAHGCDEATPEQLFDKVCNSDDDWDGAAFKSG